MVEHGWGLTTWVSHLLARDKWMLFFGSEGNISFFGRVEGRPAKTHGAGSIAEDPPWWAGLLRGQNSEKEHRFMV